MRKIFTPLFFISLFFSLTASTCKKATMESANKSFEKKDFNEAAEAYKEVARTEKNKKIRKEALYQEGLSHLMTNNYKDAEKAFGKAMALKTAADNTFYFESLRLQAESLKLMEKYTEAINKYNEYLAEFPDAVDVKRAKEGCELALKWKDQKTRYIIENVKKANTKESDFAPFVVDKDGLYFTSARAGGVNKAEYGWTGQYYDDLWVMKMKKKKGEVTFTNPELVEGAVNSDLSNGVASFAEKGRLMYYTQCTPDDAKKTQTRCKIYSAKKVGKDGFEQPFLLDFNSDSFSCAHPAISPDGKQMFFVSNMPGGYGGFDIYVVNYVKRGNTWSVPLNLGPAINTSKDEMYPYVHTDGTLYFASSGLPGIGGLDIFYTSGSGQDWTVPENMMSPINSGGDDFGIWMEDNTESGYFTSNRAGGRGSDDIYSFTMKPCELFLTGVIRDEATKAVIKDAVVHIRTNTDTSVIKITTDATGAYRLPMTKNTKYQIMAKGPEYDYYFDSPTEFESSEGVPCFTTITRDLELKKLEISFTVEGILYDLDKAFIRPDAAQILDDSVISVLKRFPRIKIELGSHTDCRASHTYNDTLSQARADSAVEYIVSKGIDPERIVAKGYGENELRIKKCKCDLRDEGNKICSEAEHQLNRRTTVKVIDYNWTPTPKEPEPKPEEKPDPKKPPVKPKPGQKTPPKKTPPPKKPAPKP